MVGLKDKCRHPKTDELYIVKGSGGKNNSPEGHDVSTLCSYSFHEARAMSTCVVQSTVLLRKPPCPILLPAPEVTFDFLQSLD